MIRVENVKSKNGNKIVAVLFSDTKTEIVPNLKLGNDLIDFGSRVVTADGDIGQLDSDGTWHWIGE